MWKKKTFKPNFAFQKTKATADQQIRQITVHKTKLRLKKKREKKECRKFGMQIHSILQSKKKSFIQCLSILDRQQTSHARKAAEPQQQLNSNGNSLLVHSPKPWLTPNKLGSLLSGVPQMLFSEPFPFSEGSDQIPSPHAEF